MSTIVSLSLLACALASACTPKTPTCVSQGSCACSHLCEIGCEMSCHPQCGAIVDRAVSDRILYIDFVCIDKASTLSEARLCAGVTCPPKGDT
jgi:hypothetical protein